MTTQPRDQLGELYAELNQGHATYRELLLERLKTNATDATESEAALQARPVSRRWLLGSSCIAATAMVVGLFLWPPKDALAEIQKALQSQEWIHLVVTRLDGSQVESWESPSGKISVSKWPEEIHWLDKANSIEQVYDIRKNKLTRIEFDERQHPVTLQSLIDVLLGESDRTSWLKVAQRHRRNVTENGRTWDEVTLTTEPIGGQALTWICKIDPKTHLPISYRTQVPTGQNLELGWVEGKLDYPANGPLTIADLGVPADAQLDDRIPKDSLKHIVATMHQARQRLGAYHLKLFYGDGPQLCREYWKHGSKWRQDRETPEICDGKELWIKTLSGWERREVSREHIAGWPCIEDMTYPRLSANMEYELKVRSDQTEGPEGCILVEKLVVDDANPLWLSLGKFTPRREQFWLDTNRDYALVKHVRTDVLATEAECRANQSSKHSEYHYSEFKRSPSGIWYPTKIKTIGTMVAPPVDPAIAVPEAFYQTIEVQFAESYPKELFDINAAKMRFP